MIFAECSRVEQMILDAIPHVADSWPAMIREAGQTDSRDSLGAEFRPARLDWRPLILSAHLFTGKRPS